MGIKEKIVGLFSIKDDSENINVQKAQEDGSETVDINDKVFRDDIIAFVNTEFDRRKTERAPLELQWRLNMNFLEGNQYMDINEYALTLMPVDKVYWWQEQEVYNHIAPIVETRLSKLGRIKPSMIVLPGSSELNDVSTAKVSTAIVKSNYRKFKMKDKINKATAWAEITGTVFYKTVWDKMAGQVVGQVDDDVIHEGDNFTTVTNSFEVFPDNLFNEFDECKSIIHAKAYTVEAIKEIWGVEVGGSDVDVFSLGMSSIGTGGLGYNATIPRIIPTVKKDSATVLEYQEKPSRKYPDGRLIICTKDELLWYGPLPYINGEDKTRDFSFTPQYCIYSPGHFFGTSIIERCIPIQRSYNAIKNRKHDFLNRTAIGVWTVEDDSSIDLEDLQEDGMSPGKVIVRGRGAAPPAMVSNGQLPPEFMEEEKSLEQAFIMISGVSEISRNSQAPTGAGSGVALQILKEQDDTRISLTADNIKNANIDIAKKWIRQYRQYATGPRMSRLVGDNNEAIIYEWNKNMLTSDDVIFETEDELANTPAQKKQTVYDLLKAGLLVDPTTGQLSKRMRSKVLEMLDMANVDSADDIEQLHINKAQKENMDIQHGIFPNFRDFDDHEIHVYEHNRFRLSGDYDKLMNERPDLCALIDKHVQDHENILQQRAQQQMLMQQSMQQSQMPPQNK